VVDGIGCMQRFSSAVAMLVAVGGDDVVRYLHSQSASVISILCMHSTN